MTLEAYFSGVLFGKTKLFERISPKKSWEGSVGGAAFAILAAWIISIYFAGIDPLKSMGVAIIVVIVGTYGDLVESHFKRTMRIKNSSSSIPGHGGF